MIKINQNISIIIPAWNEAGNIALLVETIAKALTGNGIIYELIVVDDNSTDTTAEILKELTSNFPISVYLKKGKKGKAQSLLEGFTYAKYDLVGFIDADLQYPAEAIPKMVEVIDTGVDIVVANRKEFGASFRRKVLSWGFRRFFGQFLHGFTCDVQSGLKVFRKEIIERLTFHPNPWTFDLEFLVKARDAGYKIGSTDIIFQKRHAGKPKIGLLAASLEIGLAAIKIKLTGSNIIPFHPELAKKKGQGFHYKGIEFIHHSDLHHKETAFHRFNYYQEIIILSLFFLVIFGIRTDWHATLVSIFSLITVLYFTDLLFNLYLIFRSLAKETEIQVTDEEISQISDKDWPSYTIFCPLYREWEVLPQFVTAISRLDYPKDKLQVLLLLEEDDRETIKYVKNYYLPSYFQVEIVPHSLPKTKPKALNYGLYRATGEFSVVYDAEDVPDPKQLKKAVLAFRKSDERIICVQAKLNFYNSHQNILTRVFTAEYSLWFDLILTGLQSLDAPIPLGGTSNHFKTYSLRHLKGWDAFNVTEDCDLGIRLTKQGFRTSMIDSVTLEEANCGFFAWFRQRSRWVKGYIQTYLVHMRRPHEFIRPSTKFHLLFFQLVVGGKIVSMWINPFLWSMTIAYFALRAQIGGFIESLYLLPIFYLGAFSLVFGNFVYFYNYMIGTAKKEQWDLIKYAFLTPFYWLMMSIGSWIALKQFAHRPHYWEKTRHGLHLGDLKITTHIDSLVNR
ncbi:hypothetical protein A2960_01685 [Candidatus Gottesmanbacteria bacterium RIFCSPLOWO2_01_FULL_39_12b]|uniref:Glycosyltransferase 2-like domain-containing protein n=1 Tax=Candidatus Gottesmanbacteria bacterium RIFCSPLOWO2_01_FULL_39_12b TaxID=1798388 RepID=A0A1F6AQ94_9BACT|nr:MAG: hypothetical protein A2960_01685 [Candidatus Gottesmanbacteria bacterium RIFCSPLOWO2_01_FULL_39_12b]